jgi:hypothetical protein
MSKPDTMIERLVDEFITLTGGECDPARYRQAMIVFWDKALKDAHDAGWNRKGHVEINGFSDRKIDPATLSRAFE